MKKIILFLIMSFSMFSKDISINLKQDVINKFLSSAGFFSATSKIDLKVSEYEFQWKVYDARVDLTSKTSKFEAKVDLTSENKTRNGTIEGDAKFKFDKKTQNLVIDVKDLKVRGLGLFNLTSLYKPKYQLPIRLIKKEKIEIKRGENVIANLIPELYEESVTVGEGTLLIEANIKFVEE